MRPHRPTYAATGTIEVLPVQGSVYLLAGGGSNVVVQVGDDAVFVVDTNTTALGEKVLAAIRTHLEGADPLHRQHVGGSRSRGRQRSAGRVGRRTGQCRSWGRAPGSTPTNAPTCASPIRPTATNPAPVAVVADRCVRRREEDAVRHRRADRNHSPAGRAHRRRRDGVLPQVGRDRRRRRVRSRQLSGHRHRARRDAAGRHRRA